MLILLLQFANPELMRQYGRLLEDFQNNTPFLNDCIFTVISLKLTISLSFSYLFPRWCTTLPGTWTRRRTSTCHPSSSHSQRSGNRWRKKETIIKKISNLNDFLQGLQICEDWVDLIEFIIQKFIQTMGSSPHTCAANMVRLESKRRTN